jgi:hypothetical protein
MTAHRSRTARFWASEILPSYLNRIEQIVRPFTVAGLIRMRRRRLEQAARCASGPLVSQHAFPPIGRQLSIDPNGSRFAPIRSLTMPADLPAIPVAREPAVIRQGNLRITTPLDGDADFGTRFCVHGSTDSRYLGLRGNPVRRESRQNRGCPRNCKRRAAVAMRH